MEARFSGNQLPDTQGNSTTFVLIGEGEEELRKPLHKNTSV
jgi:hypothetical protein